MAAKDLRAQPNLTTKATTIREGGRSYPAIHVSKFGLPLFIAETRDGKVVRALIVSERYRTAGGAHVGSAARDLERLFGPGKLEASGPDACAEFAKAPGLGFCFRGAAGVKDWASLAQANPRVGRIVVEDTAELSELEGPAPMGSGSRKRPQ
jgi:hypothetical protein